MSHSVPSADCLRFHSPFKRNFMAFDDLFKAIKVFVKLKILVLTEDICTLPEDISTLQVSICGCLKKILMLPAGISVLPADISTFPAN